MVTKLATDAGLAAESLYFNIARAGNLSAACIRSPSMTPSRSA